MPYLYGRDTRGGGMHIRLCTNWFNCDLVGASGIRRQQDAWAEARATPLRPDLSREDLFDLKCFLSSCTVQLLISFVRSKRSCLEQKFSSVKSAIVHQELSSDSPSKSEPIPDCPSSRCVKCFGKIRFSSLSSQTLPVCRGPGPLQSHKLSGTWDTNLIFPKHFTQRDEGQSAPGTQIWDFRFYRL